MALSPDEMEKWFKAFDKDGSGKIEPAELTTFVKNFRKDFNLPCDDAAVEADVQAIMKDVDTSKDGKLDKQEFFRYFSK